MNGTFKKGDYLHIKKIEGNNCRIGDIIVFKDPSDINDKKEIVHRILKITSEGITTKGDNNRSPDKFKIKNDKISGIVYKFERTGKSYSVSRGKIGMFNLKINKIFLNLKTIIIILAGFPYDLFFGNANLSTLWNPSIKKGWFNLKNGLVVKFIRKGKVIAKWYPEINKFNCRKFYRPFLKPPEIKNSDIELFKDRSLLRYGFSDLETNDNPFDG